LLLIEIAESADVWVIATTAPENNASTRILQKYGFKQTAIVQNEEIGDPRLWELKKKLAIEISKTYKR